MLQDNKKYIGKMFSNKDLKILIVPLIIEQFLAITVGMSDTVMVSFAGEAAVSGVSLVDMVNNVIISLLAALATGGAVVISQFIGAKKHEDACMAAAQLELMAFSVALFISIFTIIFAHPLISFLFGNIDNEVFAACKKYLIITAISFPMLAIYNSGAAIYRSIGDSKTSMKVSILMNVINVVGNYIGVFKLHLGVAGVAIPSVVSRGVAAIVITLLASNNKNALVYLKIKEVFSLQMNFMRRILYIGIPSGIENSLFQVGRVAVVSIISNFGRTQIAANAIANNIDGLGVNMGNALGIAMITVIGRCVGAGNYKE
ncbi:MAG: MATE family efflux transporter, partial [Lachnoanaerobaculum saburreum]